MSRSSPSSLPCVCFVEDDWQKRQNLVYDHAELFASAFELRFIICEQQFWDRFGPRGSRVYANTLGKTEHPRGACFYGPDDPTVPHIMVVDMMLEWKSKAYDSGQKRPAGYTVNRAGARIGKHITDLNKTRRPRIQWFYWMANSCEHLRAELPQAEIYYKDGLSSEEILRRLARMLQRQTRHAG